MCDGHHGTVGRDARHSGCQHGSEDTLEVLFEPGDTKQQWKGEAAASFVS